MVVVGVAAIFFDTVLSFTTSSGVCDFASTVMTTRWGEEGGAAGGVLSPRAGARREGGTAEVEGEGAVGWGLFPEEGRGRPFSCTPMEEGTPPPIPCFRFLVSSSVCGAAIRLALVPAGVGFVFWIRGRGGACTASMGMVLPSSFVCGWGTGMGGDCAACRRRSSEEEGETVKVGTLEKGVIGTADGEKAGSAGRAGLGGLVASEGVKGEAIPRSVG